MIRAFDLGRFALQVIRQRQPQSSHADRVEDAASLDVTFRLRVPLRQHDDGFPRFLTVFGFYRKVARVRGVVFDRRRLDRARPGELIGIEAIIGDFRQRARRALLYQSFLARANEGQLLPGLQRHPELG